MKSHTLLALLLSACIPAIASAQDVVSLTLEEAVRIAVADAPRARAAAATVAASEARILDARLSTAYNPRLEVAAGPRFGDEVGVDFEVGIERRFALGGQRRAAVAVAEIDVDVSRARVDETRRRLAERAATAYLRALHADQRLAIARESRELSNRVAEVARRRYEEGETDLLQSNTARLTLGRNGVQVVLWESRYSERLGELRAVLGFAPTRPLSLGSTLEGSALPPLEELAARAENRPDLAALRAAEKREAARLDLAGAHGWPQLGLGVSYAREESADIVMGIVSLTLPIFSRGQAIRALAGAERQRVLAEHDALHNEIFAELVASHTNHHILREAQTAFQNEIVPALEANESMVQKAYEAGAVDLPALLAMRAEMIAARESYADLLLEVALAAVHTRAIAGALILKGD